MRHTKSERSFLSAAIVLALCLCVPASAGAMHIMEGYLPVGHCILWGAVCLPFLAWGLVSIKRIAAEHRKAILLLAMMGAYAFVLSALKIPSVSGSSSHPTGTGLGAVLFGAPVMAVLGIIVLLFQALLLAHGGLTTLGANTFSMAIAGPFVSWGVYSLLKKCKVSPVVSIGVAWRSVHLCGHLPPAGLFPPQRGGRRGRVHRRVHGDLRRDPDPAGCHRGHPVGGRVHAAAELCKARTP